MPGSSIDIRARQAPLRQVYTDDPAAAPRTLRVRAGGGDLGDPLHATVTPESVPGVVFRAGAHPAVGGEADAPCSADLLLAALAACQEITLRMVAANMGIALEELEVTVEGDWDPRGTLAMGKEFPVGLTAIREHTRVVADGRGAAGARGAASAQRRAVLRRPGHPAQGRSRRVDVRAATGLTAGQPAKSGRADRPARSAALAPRAGSCPTGCPGSRPACRLPPRARFSGGCGGAWPRSGR